MLILLFCWGGGDASMTMMSLAERLWDGIGKRGVKAAVLYSQYSSAQRSEMDQLLTGWMRAGLVTRDLGVLERTPKAIGLEYEEMMATSGLAATRGVPATRDAVMPIAYEEACKAIATCTELDEAKTWGDKADALAAWARIYRDDKVSVEARRLKLHAYRRMSQLADELHPAGRGTVSSLREAGLSDSQAGLVRGVGRVPQRKFDRAVASSMPPTPSTLAVVLAAPCPEWKRVERALGVLLSVIKHNPPVGLAGKLPPDQVTRSRRMLAELREWSAAFDRVCAEREDKAA